MARPPLTRASLRVVMLSGSWPGAPPVVIGLMADDLVAYVYRSLTGSWWESDDEVASSNAELVDYLPKRIRQLLADGLGPGPVAAWSPPDDPQPESGGREGGQAER